VCQFWGEKRGEEGSEATQARVFDGSLLQWALSWEMARCDVRVNGQ